MDGIPYRQRLTFEAPIANRNSDGENIQTWNEVATVWGTLTGLNGKQIEILQANTITATATHHAQIRYRTDIATVNRITLVSTVNVPGFSCYDLDQVAALTLDEIEELELNPSNTITRHFRINSIVDPEGRRRKLNIVCTELKA
jgi:SPP1 family predicted phage head-tail adaptor